MKIQAYNSKIQFPPLISGVHYYGAEVEIESLELTQKYSGEYVNKHSSSYMADIQSKANTVAPLFKSTDCIFKFDSSLLGGFEMVFRPMRLEEAKEFWTLEKFNKLAEKGFICYDSPRVGLHFHTNRDLLPVTQMNKIYSFVYGKENYPFVRKIAQRDNKQQASFKNSEMIQRWQYPHDKHTALNANNPRTLEFRLFKGTLNRDAFHKNLEFIDALVHFTKNAKMTISENSKWWNFIEFVKENEETYPNLFQYCIDKSIADIRDWENHLKLRRQKKEAEKLEQMKAERLKEEERIRLMQEREKQKIQALKDREELQKQKIISLAPSKKVKMARASAKMIPKSVKSDASISLKEENRSISASKLLKQIESLESMQSYYSHKPTLWESEDEEEKEYLD